MNINEAVKKSIEAFLGRADKKIVDECIEIAKNCSSSYELMAELKKYRLDISQFARELSLIVGQAEANVHGGSTIASEKSWEQQQAERAAIVKRKPDQEYDFVMDNAVSFSDSEVLSEEEEFQSEEEVDTELPVMAHRMPLMRLIRENQFVIVCGETGSGKTTKLPQFLHKEGYSKRGKISCTQPRRLAAMSVAARVANETQTKLGSLVGYTIRFEDRTSVHTRIQYMTDGMLLREFLIDPDLSKYSAIMIDEAHERSLHTDVLLALMKDIARARPELRVIISSATLNAKKFSAYFNSAPVYTVPGRRFPVTILYTTQPEVNYVEAAATTIFQIHATQDKGDVLVFVPGQEDIENVAEAVTDMRARLGAGVADILVCPIYANLPPEQQALIFEPTPAETRKIVIATNIAETSITIEGISFVIDSGLMKQNQYDPRTGMDSLVITECSQASADQRAGRAGRTGPGKCFRLYTKQSFAKGRPQETVPEVLRTNLASVVLLLLSIGITDVLHFDFLDRPEPEALVKALELLYSLGAVTPRCELTKAGRQMAELPVGPMMSRTVIAAQEHGCIGIVLPVIALLDEMGSLFYRPKNHKEDADRAHESFRDPRGDHFMLLKVWKRWQEANESSAWCRDYFVQYRSLRRARDVVKQLRGLVRRLRLLQDHDAQEGDEDEETRFVRAFTAGYFTHTAKRLASDGFCTLTRNQHVQIHPSSALFRIRPRPKYVLYHELVLTSKEYMRGCLTIEPSDVQTRCPHFYKKFFEERGAPQR